MKKTKKTVLASAALAITLFVAAPAHAEWVYHWGSANSCSERGCNDRGGYYSDSRYDRPYYGNPYAEGNTVKQNTARRGGVWTKYCPMTGGGMPDYAVPRDVPCSEWGKPVREGDSR